MAIDNLNYYSNGLPAGQLTDKYSTQPGCLKSKNLDIFSSSKSVKATAWSTPVALEGGIIKQDGKLLLKTDGKVYERTANGDVLVVDPSVNFPGDKVCYTGKNGTYANAVRGTSKDLVAKYNGDELESFAVFTDRSSYVWRKYKEVANKSIVLTNLSQQSSINSTYGYDFTKPTATDTYGRVDINLDGKPGGNIPIRIKITNGTNDHAEIAGVQTVYYDRNYYYDAQTDSMQPIAGALHARYESLEQIMSEDGLLLSIPAVPEYVNYEWFRILITFSRKDGYSDNAWYGHIYVDMNGGPTEDHRMLIDGVASDGDYAEYYAYLPIDNNRKLKSIGSYGYSSTYWMKGATFQYLYKWTGSWISVSGENKTIYDFVQDMGWETDVSMDIIGMIIWNEQVYMIGNMDGNGYIIPCDLTGGKGTPYIGYGCTFRGAANIDYLMYLVGEDRGISQLWVYNGQELVAILGGTEENNTVNLIDNTEQYKFDGKMVEYRGDLILSTSDNRIFGYGQTSGGKGGAFIHELPGTITDLKAEGNDLKVIYTVSSTDYITILQDDTPIKNYNTEWVTEYPIVIGNHLLEKEETDLYCSYILPSSNCKLEFWGDANHYTFWTFTSSDTYQFSTTADYKLKGCTGNYVLKYIETNGNQYTFRLEGDLPIHTTNNMKITDTEGTELITYSDFNHFRKIGEITTDKYVEGEFRFTNLNTKLDLPRSHSLQIMVKGKGTANHTPELFAVDLVANQRERG